MTAVAPALTIGGIDLSSPVILAPMAGVTNMPFRVLCREIEEELTGTSSGLYVCEMVTARALVERNEKTLHMTTFAPQEDPRSLQIYTVDPEYTYKAAKIIVDENLADHIDMNFGCPVHKVTMRSGGSALPYKRRLFGNIVSAAVKATEGTNIPVTVKMRMGWCHDSLNAPELARIADFIARKRDSSLTREAMVEIEQACAPLYHDVREHQGTARRATDLAGNGRFIRSARNSTVASARSAT